ncbi:SAM-dependent methyltransferase [Nocardioides mangrovicus]|uniref:S-adenosyl-L-methionine-dependent methyltransferase n=1 Tax=Nocardioides mangrovicus TaxID=2478913 RepID=A0A3L8P3M3_9ACTN|nr:SAM-dependent methyltransferase [Nocardioides mangrovicus]RLV49714.1 SAM-dependent methyltransferase [Nocardioides mangrovicus]
MIEGAPSRTAFGAARHRAQHQVIEGGSVFRDPLAVPILGAGDGDLGVEPGDPRRPLRIFIAMRHRFAEDALAAAYERGVRQAVVLGAGLDTIAYRNPHEDLRVLEVDHLATGEWKRERLREAGIAVPATARYVGVDFERDDLRTRLVEGGLDPDAPAFFAWLGVVPYLTREAITTTLRTVADLDGEVVLDYPLNAAGDARAEALRADLRRRTEAVGEPLLSSFAEGEVPRMLTDLGFTDVEDVGAPDLVPRYLGVASRGGSRGGGRLVRARR